ncbi:Adenylate cyclase type 10 like protein [Argiope bruennichi]|uniref:Adenylate cyclase type 10 like protein n=1 Tax=Argiope bruennichi TaxID=94029 RepID=A0A8T0FBX7_ARGBR|nr:Adenylate cyclase type 10 like protein [Argiope bruennichi]
MAAGGDVIGLEAGYIQCLWLARLEEMSDLASKILDVALSIQRKYGNTETRFGRSIRNQIGISCGDIKCFFVGCKTIHFVLIGDAVSDSFHAASQCGCNEVVVSREFWKSVIQIEDYKYQTLPDEYVTIYSVDKNSDVSADPEVVASKSSSSEQTLSGVVKRILYNQGIIVSVYFGYPGFKRSNDVIRSVQFSQEVFKTLKQAGLQVNIGISSGLIFCGLIGPPTRMEWCLIGMAIKIAHQLSKAYEENAILCGLATYFLTRRFVGDIFDPVKEKIKVSSFMDPELHFEISAEPKKSVPEIKCIGREDEKKELTKALAVLKYKVGELEDKLVPLFLVIGKMGMGKSTLLKWTMEKADDIGFSFSSHVENLSFEESFENAWKIVHEILQKSGNDTEEKILNLVDKNQKDFPLHILNDRLNTELKKVYFGIIIMRVLSGNSENSPSNEIDARGR